MTNKDLRKKFLKRDNHYSRSFCDGRHKQARIHANFSLWSICVSMKQLAATIGLYINSITRESVASFYEQLQRGYIYILQLLKKQDSKYVHVYSMKFKNMIAFDTFHHWTNETDRKNNKKEKKKKQIQKKKERNRNIFTLYVCASIKWFNRNMTMNLIMLIY